MPAILKPKAGFGSASDLLDCKERLLKYLIPWAGYAAVALLALFVFACVREEPGALGPDATPMPLFYREGADERIESRAWVWDTPTPAPAATWTPTPIPPPAATWTPVPTSAYTPEWGTPPEVLERKVRECLVKRLAEFAEAVGVEEANEIFGELPMLVEISEMENGEVRSDVWIHFGVFFGCWDVPVRGRSA